MKGPLFNWGLVLRYVVYGAGPFLAGLWLSEVFLGAAGLGAAIIVLSALLPFYAVGWLGYQHWKHSRTQNSRSPDPRP
jgi:hypothetical protein